MTSSFIDDRVGLAPNWAVHPGEVLAEQLDAYSLKPAELARRAGLTPKLLSEIISGKNSITADTAHRLGPVLGLAPIVWCNLQGEWDLFQARRRSAPSPQRIEAFLKALPIHELMLARLLPNGLSGLALLDRVLAFVGVGSIDAFELRRDRLAVHYRHSPKFQSSPDHVFAWLQIGDSFARHMNLPEYDRGKFKTAVRSIRDLTIEAPGVFWPRMVEACREAGVALVLAKPFSGTKLSGAARWTDGGNPVIQL